MHLLAKFQAKVNWSNLDVTNFQNHGKSLELVYEDFTWKAEARAKIYRLPARSLTARSSNHGCLEGKSQCFHLSQSIGIMNIHATKYLAGRVNNTVLVGTNST